MRRRVGEALSCAFGFGRPRLARQQKAGRPAEPVLAHTAPLRPAGSTPRARPATVRLRGSRRPRLTTEPNWQPQRSGRGQSAGGHAAASDRRSATMHSARVSVAFPLRQEFRSDVMTTQGHGVGREAAQRRPQFGEIPPLSRGRSSSCRSRSSPP